MNEKKQILVMMGSFRKASYSRSVANYAASIFSDKYEVTFPALDALSFYNQDLDVESLTPESWKAFRLQIEKSDGVLFVTPEYNRSFPGVLKNAMDIASRPYGENKWDGKPAAIISVSDGRVGGALSNQQLRQPMSFLNIRLMLQPEMYVSGIASMLDSGGVLTDESTRRHIDSFIEQFEQFIESPC